MPALNRMLLGALVVMSLGMMAGCGFSSQPKDPNEMLLRSYDVPEGLERQDVSQQIHRVMGSGSDSAVGRVTYGSNRTILVTAPASIQRGVEELIEKLAEMGPKMMAEPSSIAINYWAIVGRPSSEDGSAVQFGRGNLETQKNLRPVLEEIARTQGSMTFYLLEHLRIVSIDQGNWNQLRGNAMEVRHKIAQGANDVPLADIAMKLYNTGRHDNSIESRIKLEDGKMIVLGQAGYTARGGYGVLKGIDPSEPLMLFYVISAVIE